MVYFNSCIQKLEEIDIYSIILDTENKTTLLLSNILSLIKQNIFFLFPVSHSPLYSAADHIEKCIYFLTMWKE